jgi:phage tail tape-measure protein
MASRCRTSCLRHSPPSHVHTQVTQRKASIVASQPRLRELLDQHAGSRSAAAGSEGGGESAASTSGVSVDAGGGAITSARYCLVPVDMSQVGGWVGGWVGIPVGGQDYMAHPYVPRHARCCSTPIFTCSFPDDPTA